MFADIPSLRRMVALQEHGPPTSFRGTGKCNPGKGAKEEQEILPQQAPPSVCRGPDSTLLYLALGCCLVPGGGRNMEIARRGLRPGSGSDRDFGKSRDFFGVSLLCNPAHRLDKQMRTGPKSWTEIERLRFA